jgi:polyhydroxyalkanoate synthesis regulator phasin
MKRALLTSVATLTFGGTLGGVLAQNSFPDVPPDSYAADAVSQLVELGIVNGFPDGTFRGNEAFTRYQAALVVSRLLDVIEENSAAAGALSEEDLATVNNAVAELSNELTALSDRVAALEAAPAQAAPDLSAIEERLGALEAAPTGDLADTFTALEGRVAALEEAPAPAAPGPELAALQEQVTALNQQVNDLQAQLEAAGTTPAPTDAEAPAEEPAVDLAGAGAAPDAVALSGERGKFYFGVGGFYEIGYTNLDDDDVNGRFFSFLDDVRVRPRVMIGVDDVVAGFGLRATADYGRQSLINSGSLAASGHLTYTLGASPVSAYLGLGGGYQFDDIIFPSGVGESPFAGALLGAEFGSGSLTFFVEGTADYYFNDTLVEGYEQIYPTVAAGFKLRP